MSSLRDGLPRGVALPPPGGGKAAPAGDQNLRLKPGAMLGPFQILDQLGAGGMGEVYRAMDTRLGRDVALKVLPTELLSNSEGLKRFALEARSASALNHPYIVTIFEVGQAGSSPYLAMELINGWTLRQLMEAGALPVKRVLDLATQIANGLAKAHQAGIVHRDLKREHHGLAGRLCEDPGLRAGQVAGTGVRHRGQAGRVADASGVDHRDARVHVARAGGRPAARLSLRPVFGGSRHLRDADQSLSLRARDIRSDFGPSTRSPLPSATYDVAIAELMQANQQNPQDLYRLCQAYEGKGDAEKAKSACKGAAEFNSLPAVNLAFVRTRAQAAAGGKN